MTLCVCVCVCKYSCGVENPLKVHLKICTQFFISRTLNFGPNLSGKDLTHFHTHIHVKKFWSDTPGSRDNKTMLFHRNVIGIASVR